MSKDVSITIVGTATRDVELRFSASGMAVAGFGIAVNDRQKNKDTGQWEDGEPSFYDVTAFGQFAENVAESVRKGTRVVVFGTLKQDRWEKDGQKHSKHKIIADAIGPDLRFATASVNKAERSSGGGRQAPKPENPFEEPDPF